MPLTPGQEDVLIVHSSDLHVDDGYTARAWGGDGTAPLAAVLDAARHIVAAHGHFAEERGPEGRPGPGWLFTPDDIEATGADYVALGHWNRKVRVGTGTVPAWYSGSPDYAGTVNVIRLGPSGGIDISHTPVAGPPGG